MDGEQWTARFIYHIWMYIFEIWKNRNGEVHGEEYSSTWMRQKLQEEVKMLYRQKDKIDVIDQNALQKPITTILNKSNRHMHEWINRTTPRITAAIRRSKERIQTTTISIAEYMKENPNLQQARETLKKAKNKAKQNTNHKTNIK